MKNIKLTMLFLILSGNTRSEMCATFSDDGELRGKVKDKETGQPLPFAGISIMHGEQIINGVSADENGNYKMKPLQPGTYDVKSTYIGYQSASFISVIISAGNIT